MNKNLTVQNVGILFELGFAQRTENVFTLDNIIVNFWANDHIQIATQDSPSSRIVDTFADALEVLESLGIK
jgi:hypothetical protein